MHPIVLAPGRCWTGTVTGDTGEHFVSVVDPSLRGYDVPCASCSCQAWATSRWCSHVEAAVVLMVESDPNLAGSPTGSRAVVPSFLPPRGDGANLSSEDGPSVPECLTSPSADSDVSVDARAVGTSDGAHQTSHLAGASGTPRERAVQSPALLDGAQLQGEGPASPAPEPSVVGDGLSVRFNGFKARWFVVNADGHNVAAGHEHRWQAARELEDIREDAYFRSVAR